MIRRVTWTAVPVASFGLFAWLPFFYLALNRRSRPDIAAAAVTFTLSGLEAAALTRLDTQSPTAAAFGFGLIFYMAATAVTAWTMLAPVERPAWSDGTPLTDASHS